MYACIYICTYMYVDIYKSTKREILTDWRPLAARVLVEAKDA